MSSLGWFLGYQQTPVTSGAIDAIATRKSDGQILQCSPFHVKLPMSGQNSSSSDIQSNKSVLLSVNGKSTKVAMKLGKAGEAFFIHRISKVNHSRSRRSGQMHNVERKKPKPMSIGDVESTPDLLYPGSPAASAAIKNEPTEGESAASEPAEGETAASEPGSVEIPAVDAGSPNSPVPSGPDATSDAPVGTDSAPQGRSNSFWIWSWGALPTNKSEKSLDKLNQQLTQLAVEGGTAPVDGFASTSLIGDAESNWSTSVVVSPDLPEFRGDNEVLVMTSRSSRSPPPLGFPSLTASNAFIEAGKVGPLTTAPDEPTPSTVESPVSAPVSVPAAAPSDDSDISSDDHDLLDVAPQDICPDPPVGDLRSRVRTASRSRSSSVESVDSHHSAGAASAVSLPLPPAPTGAVDISTINASYLGIGDDDSSYDSSNSYNSTSDFSSSVNSTEEGVAGRRADRAPRWRASRESSTVSNIDTDSDGDDSGQFFTKSRSSSFDSMSSSSYDCRSNSYVRNSFSDDAFHAISPRPPSEAGSLQSCPTTAESAPAAKYRYRKSLFPSTKQLQRLALVSGKNDICFDLARPPEAVDELKGLPVAAAEGGTGKITSPTSPSSAASSSVAVAKSGAGENKTPQLKLYLFVWPELKCRIIIVNIDGVLVARRKAVTTNSIIGSIFLGVVGGNSSSVVKYDVVEGAVELLCKLAANGYSLLYIASNAVAAMIRRSDYAICVNGSPAKACLPFGPIIQPPDALMTASAGSSSSSFGASIMTESASYVFKATALQGIKNLFPKNHNPFYAAFGASQCDLMAYNRCDIPDGRVYMVQEVEPTAPAAGGSASAPSEGPGRSSGTSPEPSSSSAVARTTGHCLYNVNHINYKMTFAELAEEQLYERFPRVPEEEEDPIRAGDSKEKIVPVHPSANNFLSQGDDAFSNVNYWKMPIPLMD